MNEENRIIIINDAVDAVRPSPHPTDLRITRSNKTYREPVLRFVPSSHRLHRQEQQQRIIRASRKTEAPIKPRRFFINRINEPADAPSLGINSPRSGQGIDHQQFAKPFALTVPINRQTAQPHAWKLRYDNGYTSYLEVVGAERNLFNAKLATAQDQGDVLVAMISLCKALGGGWIEDVRSG